MPSFSFFRVLMTLGNASFLIPIHGNVLSSFNRILYLGRYCLMRLFSNNKASSSVSTTKYSILVICFTKTAVFKKVLQKIYETDLYIWFQLNAEIRKFYRVTFVINSRSAHEELVNNIVANLRKRQLSSMDNIIYLS